VSSPTNPDERFGEIDSVLNQLSNSQRHLLTAQVLMNDRLSRVEGFVEQLAEQAVQTNQRLDKVTERLDRITEKIEALADSQKHTDSNIEALTEIVRQLIERNGNGRAGH
jgi:methyl-accepting chemotaxis protein